MENPILNITEDQRKEIQALWAKAVIPINPPPAAMGQKAFLGGINFRVDLLESLRATWETSKLMAKCGAIAAAPITAFALFDVAWDFYAAVSSIFHSIVERMEPINYVTAMVLSEKSRTPEQLKQDVVGYLENPDKTRFAAYFGLSDSLISQAKEVLAAPKWFENALEQLDQDGFLKKNGEMIEFKSKNFEVGLKEK